MVVNEPAALLDESTRQAFDTSGMARVPGLLSQRWLDLLADAAEEVRVQSIGDRPDKAEVGDYVFSENAWTFNEKLK